MTLTENLRTWIGWKTKGQKNKRHTIVAKRSIEVISLLGGEKERRKKRKKERRKPELSINNKI